MKEKNDIKEKLHFAKLSLFNIRLLNDLENNSSIYFLQIKEIRAKNDNISMPIRLLHQTTYLSHAYINLIWLWKSVKKESIEQEIHKLLKPRFDFKKNIKILEKGDNISLNSSEEYIKLLRNSIRHGNVEATDGYFILFDNHSTNHIKAEISWKNLGELSNAILFSVNQYYYG